MKKIFYGLLTGAMAFGVCSCSNEDNPWTSAGDLGSIHLNLITDGNVASATRANDNVATIVPDVSQFEINLTKSDNSVNKHWNRPEDFNKEAGFPMGSYTIEASFGEEGLEGFGAAYYHASENLTVRPDEETTVSMTATLANAMVSIRYTENFSKNFRAYSSAVRTEGHDALVFAQYENRAAYITPGHAEVNITMTNMKGETVTINPANFEAEARHHYIITINAVGGGSNYEDLYLDIQFEENVISESVAVNLGDALFEAPAPVVNAVGFKVEDNGTRTIFENESLPDNPRFEVFAFGGLKSVTMAYSGPDGALALPFEEIDLIGADATNQAFIRNAGLKVSGLFKNPDKMAVVELDEFVKNLHEGVHTLTLNVTDVRTLVAEPVTFRITVEGVSFTIEQVTAGKYITNAVDVYITANRSTVKDAMEFYINDGSEKEMTVTAIEELPADDGLVKYKYSLNLPTGVADAPVEVKAVYGKKAGKLDYVKYSVDVDAFAKFAKFRVNTQNTADRDAIMQSLEFAGLPAEAVIDRSGNDGIIMVSGLTASTGYTLTLGTPGFENQLALPKFTTEAAVDVPNGDFSNTERTMFFDNIKVGGEFDVKVLFFDDQYQITSSIDRSEPVGGWASINEKTCYKNSNPLNTWFNVPSTFVDGNKVIIRSVGYNHNGTVPTTSGGSGNTNYYCENTPSQSGLDKAAGELFLGRYTYNGQESRVNGIDFGSRPVSVSFEYEYIPINGETGLAEFALYDNSGNEIAGSDFSISATQSTTKTIQFSYPYGKKAAKLVIRFKSTSNGNVSVNIPSGSSLAEGIINIRGNLKIGANSYHAVATGSELRISNVHFSYDLPASEAQNLKRRNSGRR